MATNPKIRYDIVANAEGDADVRALAAELEKLDDAIDPAAAARARELAAEMRALGDKRAAVQAFLESLAGAEAAGRALDNAQQAADRFGRRMQSVEQPTRAQVGQLERLRDAVTRSQAAYTAQTATLNTARGTLDRLGIGTTDLGRKQEILNQAIARSRGEATQLTTSYRATATAAQASAATQVRAQGQVREAIAGLGDTYRRLQSLATLAIGGGIFGGMIREASQAAEAFSNLQARVRLVTGEGAAFEEAWAGVAQVANSTSTSLEATGTLFARIAQAGKDMGVSQREALALTETINQAVAVSGGGAQAAEAAITQLIQGLQAGVLRGEEFNSVMEQSPRLAKALADGLGVPIGELRKLAQAGELTTETVVRSLRGQSDAVAAEFGKLPPTVGRALQTLSNNWTLYVGEVDKANGISAAAARAITALAGNLDTLGSVLITAGQAAAAFKALQLAQALLGISAAAKAAAAAKAGETAATAANTAATVANTAAKQANVAATVASAAASKGAQAAAASSATRLLGSIGLLARFTGAVGVAAAAAALAYDAIKDSLVGLGTAIGEGVAKLLGWGEVLERNERLLQADAERAKEAAVQRARWADETRAAADAALQLGDGARKMVAEFDKLVRGGESAADALGKVTKAMDLGDTRSIQDAIAALDALAARGKITATQMRDALGAALKGIDLGTFRAQATAAFDAGENGARRLQAALQAVADEALRRAGTSARELQTGFSEAITSAVNDVDALAEALDRVGATGEEAGRLLAGSLDKALDAATTERAVQAV
nr:tape measure protein [Rubrivivax sp.]